MKKKYLVAVLLTLLCVILTGCFNGEVKINIQPDGSADVEWKMIGASIIAKQMDEFMESFKKENYKISRISEGSNIGFTATKHIENVNEINSMDSMKMFSGKEDGTPGIQLNKGWFFDSYKINTKSDLPNMKKESDSEIERSIASQMRMAITITFPSIPSNHNATNTYDDGRTLEWVFNFDRDENFMTAEAKHWNKGNILITILIPLAIILGAFAYRKKLNKRHENASDTTSL